MIGEFDFLKRKKDYKVVFESPEGKRVLKDLMAFCHYRDSTFVPNDVGMSAFNEGKRRVLLRVISLMNIPEERLNEILHEQQN